jgi:hypothetical protein
VTPDNIILIKGAAYNDVKEALRQWIDLYSDNLPGDFEFELYNNGYGTHIIQADKRLDNELFFYLVNFLYYSEGIDCKFEVEGFTIGKEEKQLKNKALLVYVSPTDTEHDNVSVVTDDNHALTIDFGGRITKSSEKKEFRIPTGLTLDNPETLKVKKKIITQEKGKTDSDKIDKRIKIISAITGGLLLISLLVAFFDTKAFATINLVLGVGVAIWFFSDYKMLQSDKHYMYGLFIALAFSGYSLLVQKLLFFNRQHVDMGGLLPLALLVTQKPTRLIYKTLFKREPVVDRPPPTFLDFIYMIILFAGMMVIPVLIMSILN